MEKQTGILIADLSGYTALTETHGSLGAADIIDRYLELVNRSLVGTSRLHERTGDEVFIVSDKADELLMTARMLLQYTRQEKHFLLIHGGLHYGALLERNGSYFGSAINLTARIASIAAPGSFFCTGEFVEAVGAIGNQFIDRGAHGFKNIADVKQVFEIGSVCTRDVYVDPICRMLIQSPKGSWRDPSMPDVYFCSEECMNTYLMSTKAKLATSL